MVKRLVNLTREAKRKSAKKPKPGIQRMRITLEVDCTHSGRFDREVFNLQTVERVARNWNGPGESVVFLTTEEIEQ